MWPTAKQLQYLCDTSQSAHRELRALYDRLWSGVMGLELRQVIDPVLDTDDYSLTIASVGLEEVESQQQFSQFASTFLARVIANLESQVLGEAESVLDVDNRQRYRDCILSRYEKSPLEFVLMVRDCLLSEQYIYETFLPVATDRNEDDDRPPSKRSRMQQSDARRDNILLNNLLSNLSSKAQAFELQQLSTSIQATHAKLLTKLSVRAKLAFVNEVCESELSQLASDTVDTLESLERLQNCKLLSADEAGTFGLSLLASCLVITSQSDRVIKKGKAKYELRLRHLCPRYLTQRLLNLRVAVLTEDQAKELESIDLNQLEKLHSESGLENQSGRCTWSPCGSATSPNESRDGPVLKMKFTSLPREMAGSGGSSSGSGSSTGGGGGGGVCHKKFALVVFAEFQSDEFKKLSSTATLAICCSLPVVFITHDSQKPAATLTVLHDSVAALVDRRGFETQPTLSTTDAVRIFDRLAMLELGFGLTAAQRDYLGLLLDAGPTGSASAITLTSLNKNKLPSLNRSMCEFVFSCIKYVRDNCPELWYNGLVYGFASKSAAKALLSQSNYHSGSFLLRFSETTCYLSVTWKNPSGVVEALEPFSPEELKSNRLVKLLNDKISLRYLVKADGGATSKDAALPSLLQSNARHRARSVITGYVSRTVLDNNPPLLRLTLNGPLTPMIDGVHCQIGNDVTLNELMGQDSDEDCSV